MTHLDPKALEAAAALLFPYLPIGASIERSMQISEAAISAYLAALPQAEPVAWEGIMPEGNSDITRKKTKADMWVSKGLVVRPLFASPTPAVIREVTEEMVERAIQAADPDFYAAAKESGPLTYQRAADSMRRALTAALSQPHSEK